MADVVCAMCGASGIEFTAPTGVWMCEPCTQKYASDVPETKRGICAAEGGHPARIVYPAPRFSVYLCERHFREAMRKAVWPKGWP